MMCDQNYRPNNLEWRRFFMLTVRRILATVLFLPCFILQLFFKYLGIFWIIFGKIIAIFLFLLFVVFLFTFFGGIIAGLLNEEIRTDFTYWSGIGLAGVLIVIIQLLIRFNENLGDWLILFAAWLSLVPAYLWQKNIS